MPRKYAFKTKPYAHQIEGIRFAFKQFNQGLGAAFLFEPRTGKTKTSIDTVSILYQKYGIRKVLIIAPNRVMGTWVQEIHTHCPLTTQVVVWDAAARKYPIPPMPAAYDMQIVITNFEAFSTPGRRTASGKGRSRSTGRVKNRNLIRKWAESGAACVIDEGHKIKNPSGKASGFIVSLRKDFAYRLLLTGTPITKANKAHDIYMQWKWINPDRFSAWGSTLESFKEHTGKWIDKNGFPQWLGAKPTGMRDLQKGIHADGLVIKREDCFDLPPRQTRIIPVQLTKSRRHYQEMAEQMVTQLESGDVAEASIPLVVTLRLSQITSGFVGVGETVVKRTRNGEERPVIKYKPVRVGTEKLDALKEILAEEVVEREEKVVIAAQFNADLNAIENLCEALGIKHWSVRGGVDKDVSDDAIRRFRQYDDGPAAMCIQPQAGSLGIDLSTASHMIWYSLTPSWVNFTQANDRIALSHNSTMYTYLIVPGSVDEIVYNSLILDGNVSKAIMARPKNLLLR